MFSLKVCTQCRKDTRHQTQRHSTPDAKTLDTWRKDIRHQIQRLSTPDAKTFDTRRKDIRHQTQRLSTPDAKTLDTWRKDIRHQMQRLSTPDVKTLDSRRKDTRNQTQRHDTRRNALLDNYLHSTYVYWLFEGLRVSSFCVDIFSNLSFPKLWQTRKGNYCVYGFLSLDIECPVTSTPFCMNGMLEASSLSIT